MERIEIDVKTGEKQIIQLTADELTVAQMQHDAWSNKNIDFILALISPNDKIYDNTYTPPVLLGYRVVAVSTAQNTPPAPLYWVKCPNNVTPTGYYYDGNGGFAALPTGA